MNFKTPFKPKDAIIPHNPPPFLLGVCGSRLVHQCLGRLLSPPQTAARSLHALLHGYATKSPLVTMGRSTSTLNLSLSVGRSPPPFTCPILGPSRPIIPNGIQIQSAVFPQYTGQSDKQTHRQTDTPTNGIDESPVPTPAHAVLTTATRIIIYSLYKVRIITERLIRPLCHSRSILRKCTSRIYSRDAVLTRAAGQWLASKISH